MRCRKFGLSDLDEESFLPAPDASCCLSLHMYTTSVLSLSHSLRTTRTPRGRRPTSDSTGCSAGRWRCSRSPGTATTCRQVLYVQLTIAGKNATIKIAKSCLSDDSEAIRDERQVVISDLDKTVGEKDLWDTFDMFGVIERVRLQRDRDTGESQRIGFVTVS